MQIRYSMIDTYLQCPSKFKALYVDNIGERQDSAALRFGSGVHMALQAFFEGDDPYSAFEMYWNMVGTLKLEYDRNSWEDLGSLVKDKFLPNFIRLHAKKFKNMRMEETLEMPILDGKHTISGTYDAACEYEGKLSIVDYKTSAREYPQAKIIRNPQMYIYAALYAHKYGVIPEQVVYKVFIKQEGRIQTLKFPLTKAKLDHMMGNVETICKDIVDRVESSKWFCNYNSCYCIKPKECFKDG